MSTIPCAHMTDTGDCAIGAYARPSPGICMVLCEQYEGPSRGLGDRAHRAIRFVTLGLIQPCEGCSERRRDANAKHPSRTAQEVLS